MSWKSIRFSIYSIIAMGLCLVALIFLFKSNFLMGMIGVVLLVIPGMLHRKALDEAGGRFDKILAKYVVPLLAVAVGFLTIMSIALWI